MAHVLHLPGEFVAKTVVLHADDQFVLAVLPATHYVDLPMTRAALGSNSVKLALEQELGNRFPDCELGAIPPFGSEYGMETLVDEALTHDETIAFEGNSHEEAFCMQYTDFEQIEQPHVAEFSRHG
jgi:Ala-tRNA(Pro) deacylase